MSLLTLRQVTSVSPIILLRSAGASWGKIFFIKIFTFSLLLLMAGNSPVLYIGGRCGSFTRRPAFFLAHFAIIQRPLLWGRLKLIVYSLINHLQLFLAFFFRLFFNWFLMSLYYLSSSGLWLLVYFLFTRRWLAIRSAHCADHIYHTWEPGFEAKQYSFSLFLIAAWILSSL